MTYDRAPFLAVVVTAIGAFALEARADDAKANMDAAASAMMFAESRGLGDVAVKYALQRRERGTVDLRSAAAARDHTADPGVAMPQRAIALLSTGIDLAEISGSMSKQSNSGAGEQRDVRVAVGSAAAPSRSPATPRVLRRIDATRVMSELTVNFRACYDHSGSTRSGSLVLQVGTSGLGSVETVDVSNAVGLSHDVVACIVDVARAAKFGPPGGVGVYVTVPVAFVHP